MDHPRRVSLLADAARRSRRSACAHPRVLAEVSFSDRWSWSRARSASPDSGGCCSAAVRMARRRASDFETLQRRAIRLMARHTTFAASPPELHVRILARVMDAQYGEQLTES
jgi:hypothetical protein